MNPRTARALALAGVLAGAGLAILEGINNLGCASTPSIVMTIAGSFGAGAAVPALFAARRREGI